MTDYRVLESADDITEEIAEEIRDTVECWGFLENPIGEDFIDKLSDSNVTTNFVTGEPEGWEILNYDNAAARKVLRIARAHKRECNG